MSECLPISQANPKGDTADAQQWLAQVLTSFAKGEQAIGRLCLSLDLPIKDGPLGSINELCDLLDLSGNRRAQNLKKRIARWRSFRRLRHVLAHCTLQVLYDEHQTPLIVTRHLPLDKEDVTPDRVWTHSERVELLRIAANDSRSIHDQAHNILNDPKTLKQLQRP